MRRSPALRPDNRKDDDCRGFTPPLGWPIARQPFERKLNDRSQCSSPIALMRSSARALLKHAICRRLVSYFTPSTNKLGGFGSARQLRPGGGRQQIADDHGER